jgi:hypothetical protein
MVMAATTKRTKRNIVMVKIMGMPLEMRTEMPVVMGMLTDMSVWKWQLPHLNCHQRYSCCVLAF